MRLGQAMMRSGRSPWSADQPRLRVSADRSPPRRTCLVAGPRRRYAELLDPTTTGRSMPSGESPRFRARVSRYRAAPRRSPPRRWWRVAPARTASAVRAFPRRVTPPPHPDPLLCLLPPGSYPSRARQGRSRPQADRTPRAGPDRTAPGSRRPAPPLRSPTIACVCADLLPHRDFASNRAPSV
jgi:hypothetical protein